MEAQRLLVGFDGSAPARAALAQAARMAERNHGCLTVVHVFGEPWWLSLCATAPVTIAPGALEPGALASLRAAVEALPEDISVVSVLCRPPVAPALVREAERHCCEAILIGARRGLWSRLGGGVERQLRRHASVELIVVPSTTSTQDRFSRPSLPGGARVRAA